MTIDAWIQHPTRRFLSSDMFASLLRWTGGRILDQDPPIEATLEQMDAAGVDVALLTAWRGPYGQDLISNDQVAQWVVAHPSRFAGLASVDLDRPMEAVRELRRRVRDDGFVGLRMLPWLWDAPPTDRRYYPLYAECVELGVPFCTQVGHTGPLRPSETGRPIPYIDQIAIDFPELTIVCGHVGYPWTEEMVAVARKHIGIVVDQIIPVTLVQDTLRQRKSGGGRNALPQGACRHFNSGIDVIFWMSGRNGAHLAKIFDFLQCHFLIARQVAKRIKQHGAVPAGQNKTVPVGPAWIFRIEF